MAIKVRRVFIKTRGMSDRVRIVLRHIILTKGPAHARAAVYHPYSRGTDS